jgi:hypothetical protein
MCTNPAETNHGGSDVDHDVVMLCEKNMPSLSDEERVSFPPAVNSASNLTIHARSVEPWLSCGFAATSAPHGRNGSGYLDLAVSLSSVERSSL